MKTLLILAAAALIGGACGYYGAMRAPVPAQIAIIDIEAVVKKAASISPGDSKAAEALTAKLKQRAEELTANSCGAKPRYCFHPMQCWVNARASTGWMS